jgi:hypothetical protein
MDTTLEKLKKYFPALPPNAIAKNLTPNTLKSTGM